MTQLSQRLRLRAIQTLELIASESEQREYQAAVPYVDVPAELFNQWDEVFFPGDDEYRDEFTAKEFSALCRFDAVLRGVSSKTPQQLPPLDRFIATDAWRELAQAARLALRDLNPEGGAPDA